MAENVLCSGFGDVWPLMAVLNQPETLVATKEQPAADPPVFDAGTASAENPPRLLIVCDGPLPHDWARAVQGVGFEYDVCDPSQFLAVLKSNAHHAALVSFATPEAAFDLIAQVRSMPHFRQVPIVAVTEASAVNSAFRAGASFAVARPVAPDLLENTLGAIYRIAVALRRQYARYRVELPLTLLLDGRPIEAKATDVGSGGMALVAAEPLAAGTLLTARFILPGTQEQITALGEIRWTDHQGRAGFCFTSIADSGQGALENWILGRHTGSEISMPKQPQAQRPASATAFEPAWSGRGSGSLTLMVLLIAFCLFVIGFWVYIGMTS